ncbi:MAG: hypothetical protein Q3992_05700 [Bacteroides sp.]|nr:hypothetical protein [Bacteroides sp.]
MYKNVSLSYLHNMSLGFLPIIATIIFSFFINQRVALLLGTAISVSLSLTIYMKRAKVMPNYILYISTYVLVLFTFMSLAGGLFCAECSLPISLEVGALIPLSFLYLNRKTFVASFLKRKQCCCNSLLAQSAEASVVSARIVLILAFIHFLLLTGVMIFGKTLNEENYYTLYVLFPLIVFLLAIVMNQIAIRYFNKTMKHVEYMPIVNKSGEVIGKAPAYEVIDSKQDYITPYVRIAICVGDRVLMRNRNIPSVLGDGSVDLAKECYVKYGEMLSDTITRVLGDAVKESCVQPVFSILHHYEDKNSNRLIYLYTLHLDSEESINPSVMQKNTLWSIENIKANIGKGLFSLCFEREFEHIKEVICIRERYKAF